MADEEIDEAEEIIEPERLQETIRRDAEPDYVKELRHEKLVTGNWENEGVSPIVDDDENPIGRAATRYANDPLDYDKID